MFFFKSNSKLNIKNIHDSEIKKKVMPSSKPNKIDPNPEVWFEKESIPQ
jgi:hypothetical protein